MIWWIIAALLAYFAKGLCGFANTLIFTTVLSFTKNNINISPVELIISYPSNIIMAVRERKYIRPKICLPLAAIVVVSSIPGMLFLKNAGAGLIKVIFGFVIIFVGVEMLLREYLSKKGRQSKVVLVCIGIVSGLLSGLYGIGALVGAYVGRLTDDPKEFRANICTVFSIESTVRVIAYILLEIITADVFMQAIVVVPFMLIGLLLGIRCSRYIGEKAVRYFVVVMLVLSGVMFIVNNI